MEWSWATAPIDKEAAYEDLFWGMPLITIALYLIFLFIFYKIVRRMSLTHWLTRREKQIWLQTLHSMSSNPTSSAETKSVNSTVR